MQIIPIGIYGSYPPAGGATSCYLVQSANTKAVLDLGSGALSALSSVASPVMIDVFVLTHLHYDHFCDALPLAYLPGKRLIYSPPAPAECFCLLKNRKNLDVRVISERLAFSAGELRFEFFRTDHNVECYAVKITENKRSFVYTSDTRWSDGLVGFCRGASVIVADCCSAPGLHHMTPAEGGRLAELTKARVIASHVPPFGDCTAECAAAGIELISAGKTITV